jgi:two-component system, chemotaxis family, CheB/CheR fusion protein
MRRCAASPRNWSSRKSACVTTREESELASEELRAANEELQSINEEYRSTSEELETSKEELQSINEELQTVNSELKLKLEVVSRANSDLQNLMAATDPGTLFLDSGLRIKRFTQQVTELFRITPSDEGRPLTDFAHQLEYEALLPDAQAVIAHLTPLKREVRSRDGRWYDVRLRPYRTVDDKIDGVVITFVDVTERLQVEQALRDSEESLRQGKRLMELSHDPIFIWDFDNGIIEWNRGSVELYGFTREEALGKHKPSFLETRVPGSSFEELRRTLLETGLWNGELQQRTKDGRDLIVESRIVLETMNGRRLALESTHDITERRLWEQRQQILLRELSHRVNNTLAVVQAIARQTLRHAPSGADFVARFDGRLAALSRAHYLLVASDWRGANLAELARSQLEAHASDASGRVYIDGESVSLPVDLATPFSPVLHELATNASKYGSLSRPEGSVHLGWTVAAMENNRRVLRLVWQEQDGPSVNSPVKTGLGTTLINTAIPGATVSREFRREGFRCTIEAPLSEQSSAE